MLEVVAAAKNVSTGQAESTVWIPVDSVDVGDTPRLAGMNEQHARDLAESGAELPPIIVHRQTMRVVDGSHRLRAAALRGADRIEATFFDGTVEDAFVLAVKLNATHGLALSLADRKAATERIITAHPRWSNRAIAKIVSLDDKTVETVRRRVSAEIPQSAGRIGRDGRVRPLDAAVGRRRAGELLAKHPDAPLRQVSTEAGVSVSTARDVRDRMRRGEDPVLAKRRASAARKGGGDRRAPVKDPSTILRHLRTDPSLRFTESGRTLLRRLDAYVLDSDARNRLVAAIPEHCVYAVADLVAEAAKGWQEFAEHLRDRESLSA